MHVHRNESAKKWNKNINHISLNQMQITQNMDLTRAHDVYLHSEKPLCECAGGEERSLWSADVFVVDEKFEITKTQNQNEGRKKCVCVLHKWTHIDHCFYTHTRTWHMGGVFNISHLWTAPIENSIWCTQCQISDRLIDIHLQSDWESGGEQWFILVFLFS